MPGHRIALFGPQVTSLTSKELLDLQSALLSNPKLQFLADALAQLPSLWPQLKEIEGASEAHGEDKLKELSNFATGKHTLDPENLTNTHLAPLSIVLQILDLSSRSDYDTFLDSVESAQGFCIGFLSAATLASSSSWTNFERNASAALRLAACIGIVVDAEDASRSHKDRAVALGVRYKAHSDRANLDIWIDQLRDAYISCVCDERLLTVTLRAGDQAWLTSRLTEAGIASTKLGLRGSYHYPQHSQAARLLEQLCNQNESLQLPDVANLRLPLRSTADTEVITKTAGPLHAIALDLILCKRAHWFQTLQRIVPPKGEGQSTYNFVTLGPDTGVVPRSLQVQVHNMSNGKAHVPAAMPTASGSNPPADNPSPATSKHEEIAVIGMACRFPQADSLDEFWQLLQNGGTSFGKLPADRFHTEDITREPKLQGNFWGNFLRRPDAFDHRFFNISGREAKSMDPQQRLALQVAYEALEVAGYHALPSAKQETDVGCYLGVGAVEYEDNLAGEDANAFSALGMLRAFISGRISHFFGWTGPSLTFDTACSSSAVAIHTACKALISGECSMALAGGVNVITSPTLHQNLAAASFLDPNGRSRAFDASAGGYCRGEGVGILVLKPLSKAVADGDMILGVVAGSAVNQNLNCSSITVPESVSQSSLYKRVLLIGGVEAREVTYVEAHGTGTQVGDPKEYESVRMALTGPSRADQLFLGSVKDNIGHCEAASGVAGVIKVLLMMHHGMIPKQANFVTLNPRITTSPDDRISIPTTTQSWVAERIALVNNYGAAGSNAAILLREHSRTQQMMPGATSTTVPATPYPILLSAKSASHLEAYVNKLRVYLSSTDASLQDVAYNLARRQNLSFKYRVAFIAADTHDLLLALSGAHIPPVPAVRSPVVLVFGGQTGRTVTVSRELYDECEIFRRHLDACDATCQALGLPTILPTIFKGEPIQDIVALHCMLLSLQVSSALSWIDSGLEIDTLLGHSFGQLSALVVAGSMSLEDGFRFVAGRACLIRDKWGPEQGAMVSLECDRSEMEMIMNLTNATDDSRIELACENGPRSFVLAGSVASVDKVEDICRSRGLRTTRLQNTHAYHSYIADAILPDLKGIAQSIAIRPPTIPVETCSAGEAWRQFDAEQLVQHTRQPVYFKDAVQRVTSRLASAIWLEAGSASPVIAMARRVVSSTRPAGKSPDIFVPVDLSSLDSGANLAHAACQLWRAGCATQYWSFCRPAHHSYSVDIALPPYQFDQTRHWIEYKHRSTQKANTKSDRNGLLKTAELVKLVENGRLSSSETLFVVNTSTLLFQLAARGHAVARQALCPASMYLEIAARCATLISDKSGQTVPHIESLTMSAPLGLSSESIVFLCLRRILGVKPGWEFTILSQPSSAGTGLAKDTSTQHAKGLITLVPAGDLVAENRLSLLTKFFRYSRAEHIMSLPAASGVHGPMVYKLFSEVVDYAEYYRGVSSLSAHQNEAAGLVTPSAEVPLGLDAGICDPVALDNFLQVAGIHVNCLSPRKNGQVFMCTAVDEVIFTPAFLNLRDRREGSGSPAAWTVYTRYEMTSSVEMENNICVYDTKSKTPVVVILGAVFKAVPLKSLERSLTRLNCVATATDLNTRPAPTRWNSCSSSSEPPSRDSGYDTLAASPCPSVELEKKTGLPFPVQPEPTGTVAPFDKPKKPSPSKPEDSGVVKRLCEMFSSILEIPIDEIQPTSTLDELGVDSLLATEVLNEIQMRFDVRISQAQLQQCPDVFRLASMIQPADSGVQLESGTVQLEPLQSKLVGGYDSGVEGLSPDDECSASSESSDFDAPPKQDMNLASLCRDTFMQTKQSFDKYADSTLFSGFCTAVHPLQSQLVVQYVVTAFASLGCDLGTLSVGDELPSFGFDARHSKLIPQLYRVLQDAGLISKRDAGFEFCRTAVPIPSESAPALHQRMLDQFPQHASETKLLHTTADKLADCLSGREDPIALIFRDADARSLLEDVYTNAPMFKTGTLVLSEYLSSVLTRLATCTTGSNSNLNRPIQILELGAGTGGTTKHIVSTLSSLDLPFKFHYTFTDLSASLVAAAKRKFSQWSSFMSYTTLDVEKEPPPHLLGAFDIVLSTNCIHATQDLIQSTTNIRKMLRQDGVLCLVELTRNLYWFDLVFGLLEGWWRFTDGREHALADEERWERDLRKAGFEWVDWTGGETEESDILRVITASPCKLDPGQPPRGITVGAEGVPPGMIEGEGGIQRETVTFKSVDGLDLLAEIYYPPEQDLVTGKSLPVALLIHGGGHIMLSRQDIRPEQTDLLLRNGFLPISIDYRLCPETTLLSGPMADVADALAWIRNVLPSMRLKRPDIRVDAERVVAVGWSTGGHLAMSLAWTSFEAGARPPEAILCFYGPTDYEDPFWKRANIPNGSDPTAMGLVQVPPGSSTTNSMSPNELDHQIWDGVFDRPITRYNVPPHKRALGGWMAHDDARSRLALYMNWHGRTLHVLLGGLDKEKKLLPAEPSPEVVASISPLARVLSGGYGTPTFIIHPREDDLIPWEQADRTWREMRNMGLDTELRILEGVPHLFDMVKGWERNEEAKRAVEDGYAFLCRYAGLPFRG